MPRDGWAGDAVLLRPSCLFAARGNSWAFGRQGMEINVLAFSNKEAQKARAGPLCVFHRPCVRGGRRRRRRGRFRGGLGARGQGRAAERLRHANRLRHGGGSCPCPLFHGQADHLPHQPGGALDRDGNRRGCRCRGRRSSGAHGTAGGGGGGGPPPQPRAVRGRHSGGNRRSGGLCGRAGTAAPRQGLPRVAGSRHCQAGRQPLRSCQRRHGGARAGAYFGAVRVRRAHGSRGRLPDPVPAPAFRNGEAPLSIHVFAALVPPRRRRQGYGGRDSPYPASHRGRAS